MWLDLLEASEEAEGKADRGSGDSEG